MVGRIRAKARANYLRAVMDSKGYAENLLNTRFEGIEKTETKLNLDSIDTEMVLVNSLDKDGHKKIGTTECDQGSKEDKSKKG